MDETINKSLMGSQFPHNFNNSIKLIFKFFFAEFSSWHHRLYSPMWICCTHLFCLWWNSTMTFLQPDTALIGINFQPKKDFIVRLRIVFQLLKWHRWPKILQTSITIWETLQSGFFLHEKMPKRWLLATINILKVRNFVILTVHLPVF